MTAPVKPVKLQLASGPMAYNEQAVKYLEELLEWARAGRLTELVAVYQVDGHYAQCYTGTDDLHKLVGALQLMVYRACKRTERGSM